LDRLFNPSFSLLDMLLNLKEKMSSLVISKRKRGYFGITFFEPKFEENIGTAIRSANCFGADFMAVIGARYKKHPGDTTKAEKHIPFFEYKDLKDFFEHLPLGCEVVGIECDGEQPLENFVHPERCVYVFGGEDRTLPPEIKTRIRIPTPYSVPLNVAVSASIVLYDRYLKRNFLRYKHLI